MAELVDGFEDIGELIEEETGEVEGMTTEEIEEVEAVGQEASENATILQKISESMKDISIPGVMKKFMIFVAQNAATGAIFYGVTVLLKKIFIRSQSSEKKAVQEQFNKIKALGDFIKQLAQTSQITAKWITDNKNVTITLEGIDVPLVDIFTKYTMKMTKDEETVSRVAKGLITKKNGKKSFNVPTTGQVATIIAASEDFISAFQQFIEIAGKNATRYPQLSCFPVSMQDMQTLSSDLKKVQDLPYA